MGSNVLQEKTKTHCLDDVLHFKICLDGVAVPRVSCTGLGWANVSVAQGSKLNFFNDIIDHSE